VSDTLVNSGPMPGAVSIREAAITLGVSTDTIRRRIADGELASFRLGATIRIPASEIRRLLEVTT
jgi:excisionase family DNA binding protein